MYKNLYSKFIEKNENIQHFACHSHHYWPDVTREAMIEYWDDSAKYVDDKWEYIFSKKVPVAQKLIANIIDVDQPEQICFAANTHEFVYRLLSCLPRGQNKKILTTDSEFYSFDRQISRVSESSEFEIEKVSTLEFKTFRERFLDRLKNEKFDMVFISHVFFNSGQVMDFIDEIYELTEEDTMIVLDGYHGFMAIPTSIKKYQDRLFYVAGSYKYAQGGEGCCFLYVPISSKHRPEYTGWFAEFGELSNKVTGQVNYANNGMKFAGATMDFCALYRLISSLELFKDNNLSVEVIHSHIQKNQTYFLNLLKKLNHKYLNHSNLIQTDLSSHGHFLTFKLPQDIVANLAKRLKDVGIHTDFREDRLRFGFGLYHNCDFDLDVIKTIDI